MAPRTTRSSTGGQTGSGHKRVASATARAAQGKRAKTVTAIRGRHFKDVKDEAERDEASPDEDDREPPSAEDEGSDFDTRADEQSTHSEGSETDPGSEDYSDGPKRKKSTPSKTKKAAATSRGSNATTGSASNGKTGYGPGTQVIIKKPKARPAGKTPYKDDTIHPNTLLFLADLKANNNRQWLKTNDVEFRQAERDFFSFVEALTERLTHIDDTIPELPVKDVIFRIYRDVRFSPDPTPYKPYFSAAWSRTGRKGPYAHYYVQIGPGKGASFVGGGLWHPDASHVSAVRDVIDNDAGRIKRVLMDPDMRKSFFGGASSEGKVVDAFVAGNQENALKTKPKGYDADHKEIQLLRLRNYTVGSKLNEDEVLGERGMEKITDLLRSMHPFITLLNSIVMPDEQDGASESDDPDDEASQ